MKGLFSGLILVFLFALEAIAAPSVIQVGGLDASGPGFSGNQYGAYRHQSLYLASEISAAGGFHGIVSDIRYYTSGSGSSLTNLNIRIKHTNATTLFDFAGGPWHEFYSGDFTISISGWTNIAAQDPFEWNGVDNIIIEYCWRNNTPGAPTAITLSRCYSRDVLAHSVTPSDGCALPAQGMYSAVPALQLVINPIAPSFAEGTRLENQNQNGGLFTAELTNGGSGTITEKGYCWNTAGSPTISDSKFIVEGSSIGVMQANITTMQSANRFHVRPYAKNSLNLVTYGSEVVVSTIPTLGEWGLIAFGSLVALIGGIVVWRRVV